ncbi:hypothetical protein Q8W40_15215 [Vibrio penaeicida]|uniref:hypothetical protein n=1 Tax=Vibrio penaeicida TaxID=104609 RepID=UPI002732D5E8|nr:hypothetical protein [Vibrio penaeicida]MDP2573542.1 hypothetical protein [Vibrio penaeicida]
MRYLLATTHKFPRFYRADGTVVEIELKYVDYKTFHEIDEFGQLTYRTIGGSPPCVDKEWMVESIEESLQVLKNSDVFPFKNKDAAKKNALRLGLETFKYIPVP